MRKGKKEKRKLIRSREKKEEVAKSNEEVHFFWFSIFILAQEWSRMKPVLSEVVNRQNEKMEWNMKLSTIKMIKNRQELLIRSVFRHLRQLLLYTGLFFVKLLWK